MIQRFNIRWSIWWGIPFSIKVIIASHMRENLKHSGRQSKALFGYKLPLSYHSIVLMGLELSARIGNELCRPSALYSERTFSNSISKSNSLSFFKGYKSSKHLEHVRLYLPRKVSDQFFDSSYVFEFLGRWGLTIVGRDTNPPSCLEHESEFKSKLVSPCESNCSTN